MLVLFALWLLDAPIVGGVPEQPNCALETAACYETLRGVDDDLNVCNQLRETWSMQLDSCNMKIATPTPDDELVWYCDPYIYQEWGVVIEESEQFLIVSNIELFAAMHLVECCKLMGDPYCESLLQHLISSEDVQRYYLDEVRPGWDDEMLEMMDRIEVIESPTS